MIVRKQGPAHFVTDHRVVAGWESRNPARFGNRVFLDSALVFIGCRAALLALDVHAGQALHRLDHRLGTESAFAGGLVGRQQLVYQRRARKRDT